MFIPCEDLDFIISLFHDAEITVNIKNIELVRDVVIIEVVIVDVVFTIVATKAKDWEWNLNETKTNTKFSLCTELSVCVSGHAENWQPRIRICIRIRIRIRLCMRVVYGVLIRGLFSTCPSKSATASHRLPTALSATDGVDESRRFGSPDAK